MEIGRAGSGSGESLEVYEQKRMELLNAKSHLQTQIDQILVDDQLKTLSIQEILQYSTRIVEDIISNCNEYCELRQSLTEIVQIIRENLF